VVLRFRGIYMIEVVVQLSRVSIIAASCFCRLLLQDYPIHNPVCAHIRVQNLVRVTEILKTEMKTETRF